MSVVGTMTVAVDATSTNASKTFGKLKLDATDLIKSFKQLGKVDLGGGSGKDLLRGSVTWLREEFLNLVDDIEKTAAAADKAGMSIEEFSKGAFTEEDVEKAERFSSAMVELSAVWDESKKELLIDIGPQVAETLEIVMDLVKFAAGVGKNIQRFARDSGRRFIGGFEEPDGTSELTRNVTNAANIQSRGIMGNLAKALIDLSVAREAGPTEAERVARHQRAELIELQKRQAHLAGYQSGNVQGPYFELIEVDE